MGQRSFRIDKNTPVDPSILKFVQSNVNLKTKTRRTLQRSYS